MTITEGQTLAVKLPKLQDQNMTIFHWNYHSETAPGRMERCCDAFYTASSIFIVNNNCLPYCKATFDIKFKPLLEEIKSIGITILNRTGTAPDHLGQ